MKLRPEPHIKLIHKCYTMAVHNGLLCLSSLAFLLIQCVTCLSPNALKEFLAANFSQAAPGWAKTHLEGEVLFAPVNLPMLRYSRVKLYIEMKSEGQRQNFEEKLPMV